MLSASLNKTFLPSFLPSLTLTPNSRSVFCAEVSLKIHSFIHSFLKRNPLSYFSFQPVLHDWCNKGCDMYYPVCGMMHIKEPLLLIDKSSLCVVKHSFIHSFIHSLTESLSLLTDLHLVSASGRPPEEPPVEPIHPFEEPTAQQPRELRPPTPRGRSGLFQRHPARLRGAARLRPADAADAPDRPPPRARGAAGSPPRGAAGQRGAGRTHPPGHGRANLGRLPHALLVDRQGSQLSLPAARLLRPGQHRLHL